MAVVAQAELTLPTSIEAPASARRFVRDHLHAWDVDERELVLVLTSELVTNAVLHAAEPIRLVVLRRAGEIRVEVEDGSRAEPVLRDPGVADLTGRGLRLVDALATAWGHAPRAAGKVVWFSIAA